MKTQMVHCPNCGSLAERIYHSSISQIETQCLTCDYLMIICASTGKVVESYAPGIYPRHLREHSKLSVSLAKLSLKRTIK